MSSNYNPRDDPKYAGLTNGQWEYFESAWEKKSQDITLNGTHWEKCNRAEVMEKFEEELLKKLKAGTILIHVEDHRTNCDNNFTNYGSGPMYNNTPAPTALPTLGGGSLYHPAAHPPMGRQLPPSLGGGGMYSPLSSFGGGGLHGPTAYPPMGNPPPPPPLHQQQFDTNNVAAAARPKRDPSEAFGHDVVVIDDEDSTNGSHSNTGGEVDERKPPARGCPPPKKKKKTAGAPLPSSAGVGAGAAAERNNNGSVIDGADEEARGIGSAASSTAMTAGSGDNNDDETARRIEESAVYGGDVNGSSLSVMLWTASTTTMTMTEAFARNGGGAGSAGHTNFATLASRGGKGVNNEWSSLLQAGGDIGLIQRGNNGSATGPSDHRSALAKRRGVSHSPPGTKKKISTAPSKRAASASPPKAGATGPAASPRTQKISMASTKLDLKQDQKTLNQRCVQFERYLKRLKNTGAPKGAGLQDLEEKYRVLIDKWSAVRDLMKTLEQVTAERDDYKAKYLELSEANKAIEADIALTVSRFPDLAAESEPEEASPDVVETLNRTISEFERKTKMLESYIKELKNTIEVQRGVIGEYCEDIVGCSEENRELVDKNNSAVEEQERLDLEQRRREGEQLGYHGDDVPP